jgi:hypothetical protein
MSTPTFACSRKNIGPAVYNFAEIIGTWKLYFRHEVHIFQNSSDQYLSSYVVAEILMETWNFVALTNTQHEWREKNWKKKGLKEKKIIRNV